ncbi:hypothetical protein [Ascidiimonas aurantiaca]|uniref:hypothetical protein n=1 Tax=Ascidiimonas aurantiaca TaxID=1685432 RepID=UPI0030EE11DB
MIRKNLKNLQLKRTSISKLNTNTVQGGRYALFSQHPCIKNTDQGKPSMHCGTLSGDSFECVTEFWTDSHCATTLE